ncbi:MAG: M28 family peptidase [Thermoleophilaceae bacterium]
MNALGQDDLRDLVTRLAAMERPSASDGERRAAELIAAELRAAGAQLVRLEEERVHGTYWWPLGLLTGLAALAGLGRSRVAGVAAGAFAAAGVADDVRHERRWFRRLFLPKRTTVNVHAELGPAGAEHTVVLVAHHDAAHSGLVFHPGPPRWILRRYPKLLEASNTTPGTLWGAFFGPLAVALGSLLGLRPLRRIGALLSLGNAAAMADIGLRKVVPGANDNLTGVAAVVSLAHALRANPLERTRVILLSTGSEESFSEGMQAWGRRHFPSLPTDSTDFICVDTVGSPRLLLLEGEGMLGIHEYPKDLIALIHRCAEEEGVEVVRDLRFRNATDGVVALLAGYRTATLGSVDEFKIPSNYHWPTDTAENVDYTTLAGCVRLVEAVLRALSRERQAGQGSRPEGLVAQAEGR